MWREEVRSGGCDLSGVTGEVRSVRENREAETPTDVADPAL